MNDEAPDETLAPMWSVKTAIEHLGRELCLRQAALPGLKDEWREHTEKAERARQHWYAALREINEIDFAIEALEKAKPDPDYIDHPPTERPWMGEPQDQSE